MTTATGWACLECGRRYASPRRRCACGGVDIDLYVPEAEAEAEIRAVLSCGSGITTTGNSLCRVKVADLIMLYDERDRRWHWWLNPQGPDLDLQRCGVSGYTQREAIEAAVRAWPTWAGWHLELQLPATLTAGVQS